MQAPPGPRASPHVQLYRWLYEPLAFFDECHAELGDTFSMRFPGNPYPIVLTADPGIIKSVFAAGPEELYAGEGAGFLAHFLGPRSLILLDGREHIRQRKMMVPPFSGERMQRYGDIMLNAADRAVSAWPVNTEFPVLGSMRDITLDIIVRAVFGVDDAARHAELSLALSRSLDLASSSPALLLPFTHVDLGPLTRWGRFRAARRRSDALIRDEIRRRRAAGTEGRVDILSLLVDAKDDAGQGMTDAELVDQLVTLLIAGHETTAVALAWTVRGLAGREDLLSRLRHELLGAEKRGALVASEVLKLPLLDATAREGLRLVPVIPNISRQVKRTFPCGDYLLTEHASIAPCTYLAHRRAEAFPAPTTFDPDRFLRGKPAVYEWFPFGGGLRRCIGMAFAMQEIKMTLATMVRAVDFTLGASARPEVARRAVSIAPRDGAPITVTRRPRPLAHATAPSASPSL